MNDEQGLSKILSMLLLVAAAALGWIGLKDTGVPRIAENRTSAQIPADEQDVVARLWEDPLQAVQAALSKMDRGQLPAESARHKMTAMQKAVRNKAGGKRFCLLVVPIPDTPFPDDLETRLRLRYSVQMALAAENLAPDNRNALGFFELPALTPSQTDPDRKAYVPYEWFMPRSKSASNVVLVLWLPEGRLGPAPLDLLKQLQDLLVTSEDYQGPKPFDEFADVFVIGPRSSDTLKKMVPDTDKVGSPNYFTLRDKLSIFSPQATTPDPLLGLASQTNWARARDDFAQMLHETLGSGFGVSNSWRYFHNFIAPDDQLTDLLVVELALRGLSLQSDDKILILAEADTQYGRSLPLALQASLDSHRNHRIHYSTNRADSWSLTSEIIRRYGERPPPDPQLLIHRYLRGLDQQMGHEGNTKAAPRPGTKSPEEALADVLSKEGAMALGESQLDYVDRLAEDLQRDRRTGKVKAVGVLGSDLYDKLILLRSLRSKFPGAVFFTTDLDARMWHPEHLAFTRNLVVASAYGVNVGAGNDHGPRPAASDPNIPPFRDGYQVAVFLACQAALRKAVDPAIPTPPVPQASLFELGRHGPEELKPRTGESSAAVTATIQESWAALLDPRLGHLFQERGLGLGLAVGGAFLAAMLMGFNRHTSTWRQWYPETRWLLSGASIVTLILLSLFFVVTRRLAELPGGESWEWKHGTSIWPTEMMRLLIICSVVTTYIWAWQHYLRARKELIRDCFDDEITPSQTSPPRSCKFWSGAWWTELFTTSFASLQSNNAVELFQAFVRKAGLGCRALRVFLATAAYMLVGFGVVFLVEGGMPDQLHIRGSVAQHWDRGLLFVSVACFLSLVFYVLDAVLITVELLYNLTAERTNSVWPKSVRARERNQFGVELKDMDGFLNVQFAARTSKAIGQLILLPFIIQFLFILSRNRYFDNWTWPGALVAIFACNLLLACTGWILLRRCAKQIRRTALEQLEVSLSAAARAMREAPEAPREKKTWWERLRALLPEPRPEVTKPDRSRAATTAKPKDRHEGLLKMKKRIEDENGGAYSRVFQDPAFFAVLLPSGMFGILAVLVRALFGGL